MGWLGTERGNFGRGVHSGDILPGIYCGTIPVGTSGNEAAFIMKRHVLIFGLAGGLLIAILQYTEYRFVVIEHSVELYSGLVAALFSAFGIWLGLRLTRRRDTVHETVVVKEVLVTADARTEQPFAANTMQQENLGMTARELEVLSLIARGLSNREIAAQLFVSENTIKTHCARVFDKLGAARRGQAVQRGRELGLLQ
jgi:two-component system, NarL family, response regulator LiaR